MHYLKMEDSPSSSTTIALTAPILSSAFHRKVGFATGVGLVFMAILGVVVPLTILIPLIEEGDINATIDNMTESLDSMRIAGLGIVIIAVLDVIVSWGLHISFADPSNPNIMGLSTLFRLVYSAAFISSTTGISNAADLLSGNGLYDAVPEDTLNAMAVAGLRNFNSAWNAALGVFGIHLLILGVVLIRQQNVPTWLGALVVLAGVGYPIDTIIQYLNPSSTFSIAAFTFFGEPILMVWLLYKCWPFGGRESNAIGAAE